MLSANFVLVSFLQVSDEYTVSRVLNYATHESGAMQVHFCKIQTAAG